MPRKKKPTGETIAVNLPAYTRSMATILGRGQGRATGIERLFAQLPLFYKVQLYLTEKANEGDSLAEELLEQMEAIGLEQAYDKAVAEGVIVVGESYIV